jgi:RNA polymerase sigma factor (sigma-70 family)
MMTDQDLLETFARGRSRAAFEEILRRHGGLVFGVCRRSLGDLQEAEDAAQSVFLVLLEKAPRLRRGTVLSAWLYRTAVFVSRNQIRARIRRERRLPEPSSPVAAPAWEEAKPHLDDALARLPQRLQNALVVHYLEGKTLAETAAALDCPLKTLEKRVGKGLERLRELLSGAGVAIGSAALVAALQREAHGAEPTPLVEAFRSRPIPPATPRAPLTLLRRLVLPSATAIVVAGFLAGVQRMTGTERGVLERLTPHASPASRGASSTKSSLHSGPADSASPTSGTLRFFPATFEEFAALYRKLAEFPESVERWAALGIDVRQEDLQAIPNLEQYDLTWAGQLIADLFRAWAGRDPHLAAEWLYRAYALLPRDDGWMPERPEHSGASEITMMEATLDIWFARDAAAVESWMKSLPAGVARDGILVEYALVAARQPGARFESLAAEVDTLGASRERRIAVTRVAEEWARRDPRAAIAWVLQLPPQDPQRNLEGMSFTLEQPRSPENYLPPLASQSNGESLADAELLGDIRLGALARIAGAWAAADLEAARQWSESLSEAGEARRTMGVIGEVWAKSDSQGALEYARAHPEAPWRDLWLEQVAVELVATDRAAAERVAQLASPESRMNILSRILLIWGELRPREVGIDTLRTMIAGGDTILESHSGTIVELTRAWSGQDPRDAAAWAMSLEKEPIREAALLSIGTAWAQTDPRAVLDWAAGVPETIRWRIFRPAVVALAAEDPDLALRAAARLRDNEGRVQTLKEIGAEWAKKAPDLALAWAKSRSPIDERDHYIQAVLGGVAERDADQAQRELASIVDDELKEFARQEIEENKLLAKRKALRKSLLHREEGKQSP